MLLGEPPPSPGDLHFRLFGIPVRVHPFFWIGTLLLGMGGTGPADPVRVLIWTIVVFVSILVHEFGHALTQRYFGGHPWVTLYGFGGLASCNDCDRSPRAQLLISIAGPLAGFIFAALVIAAVAASGRQIGFGLPGRVHPEALDVASIMIQPMAFFVAYFEPLRSEAGNDLVGALLQVNILWGLINLLPIYPLDGGQIARELFTLGSPRNGIIQSLKLSTGAAALVAAYALFQNRIFLCIMFGLLAYGSFQTLQQYRQRWR
jgi:membrane-associated protease RseP (regulator of RpoE activity)